ncbi:MAG: hypothetical protein GOMPHAMPRED_007711 [Gomphillus americanus]|uniref:Protein kinase domain-containing protein n=1 Tax=Gomphillus americanus TaxID=1940652 RepID=A0A8H3I9N8_9LECA|nr:MAG: hypothetical protein GOMPHAMPRED_007711 [Gomphillus americanus]
MEVIECNQVFAEDSDDDDDWSFHHTKLILRNEHGQYFYTKSPQQLQRTSRIDLDSLELHAIPTEDIFPQYLESLVQVPKDLGSACFLKRPSLIYYDDDGEESRKLGENVMKEVQICEILRQSPHQNVAEYLGCLVEDGRVRGLCFSRYPSTLRRYLSEQVEPLEISKCVDGIKKGMRHLHKLGLTHNDLNPDNIMVKNGEPVIIDFDSCVREGEPLGFKAGTEGWALRGAVVGRRENDLYSLQKIETFLIQLQGNQPDV